MTFPFSGVTQSPEMFPSPLAYTCESSIPSLLTPRPSQGGISENEIHPAETAARDLIDWLNL